MRRLLIVEDDENKRNQVIAFIKKSFPRLNFTTARSYQSGLRAIIATKFDLVILDMSMPTFDVTVDEPGGRTQAYAGREILRQIDRRKIRIPVIILTQFDRFGEGSDTLTLKELDLQLHQSHASNYKGAVYYSVSYEGWKDELYQIILAALGDEEQ